MHCMKLAVAVFWCESASVDKWKTLKARFHHSLNRKKTFKRILVCE